MQRNIVQWIGGIFECLFGVVQENAPTEQGSQQMSHAFEVPTHQAAKDEQTPRPGTIVLSSGATVPIYNAKLDEPSVSGKYAVPKFPKFEARVNADPKRWEQLGRKPKKSKKPRLPKSK
ncbi:hypothetical protein ACIGBH_11920 [Streptomyces sp. NPDC085929]|uniref:hypothetical protein n=1 Tax=Streptomyces sp. NPDC085929 TaxID=3365739 RepID=UPI0037CCFC01